ncbi:MAG: lysophospholipid acyltransferase family protein [Steroidobacteraceae bacterium]|nr:lysophospholipid acyltransferase family protein [Steroidobacteraceae bacterium]
MPHASKIHRSRTQRRRHRPSELEDRQPFARLPWWLRALSALPLPAWYAFARLLAWLAEHVIRHRRRVIDSQIAACFPDRDAAWVRRTRHAFYRGFAQVSVEIIKAASITRGEIDSRVRFEGAEAVRAALDSGQSVMVVTSHNCNWEWTLLRLSSLGHPIHAAYKPLRGRFGDRLMLTIRSRFGAEMIAARRLLMRVMRHRGPARIVAIVADQAPTSSGVRYFTRFMGLDTAFFVGPEAIARAAGLPVWYLAMRRESRGHYRVEFQPLAAAGEELAEGALLERYAAAVERLTREQPADWLWNYRRWKVQRDAEGNPVIVKSGQLPGQS